jgi:serine/threonine protein kinase
VAANLPRRFGDYLLTSELSEDGLGSVYRAIDVRGNGEFVRLRVFDAPGLDRISLASRLEEDRAFRTFVAGPWTAPRERAGSSDGLAWLAWSEVHGFTLDLLLDAFRQAGEQLPREHAFLIVDRIAAALEFAHRTYSAEKPVVHGLVWPGLVSVGLDGDVRLAGFGVARGIWPSLATPRIALEVAPFVAPEERQELRLDPRGDVYSVAAILLALLTGRALNAEPPRSMLRQDDGMSDGFGTLLRLSFAPAGARLPSMSDFRRELGNVLVEGGYSPSSFRFAELLRTRLGPESVQYAGPFASASRGSTALEVRDGSVSGPDARPAGDYEGEVDAVLDDYWSRAETQETTET